MIQDYWRFPEKAMELAIWQKLQRNGSAWLSTESHGDSGIPPFQETPIWQASWREWYVVWALESENQTK